MIIRWYQIVNLNISQNLQFKFFYYMQTQNRNRYFTKQNHLIPGMALKNCHVQGLHGIVFAKNGQFLERMFVATNDHVLYQNQCLGNPDNWGPLSLAVHPHRIDIVIEVITGQIWNIQFDRILISDSKPILSPFKWNSHILNGEKPGGFENIQRDTVKVANRRRMGPGDKIKMKNDELHTVFIEKGKTASWFITESQPTGTYDGVTYANHDLKEWKSSGLYQKPNSDEIIEYLKIAQIQLK